MRRGLYGPDDADHSVDILFLEFVAVDSIGVPRCAEDTDAGSNDTYHRCNRVERNLELFLQFGNKFSNSDRFCLYKEPEYFAPDASPVP